jgi:hypothetical protein
MIKYSSIYKVDKDTVAELIKKKKIHIVFIACNGLTYLNAYVCNYLGFTFAELDVHVNNVNTSLETGTLFPKANVSIIPNDYINNQTIQFEDRQVEGFIKDVFNANRLYIKSEEIVFMLDDSTHYKSQIIRVLQRIIETGDFNDPYVKTINSNGI